ncbi:YfhO family protein [Lacticaseibacillus yichunensis]|uniref:YfhO family protein n=1 Tax=Lacticaseibacillus yichunensis TaxID=2486015 RepID=A0ABW4CM59_9LACO|nr:YfhO family protein [Lacticaseibacillus yichunensis]
MRLKRFWERHILLLAFLLPCLVMGVYFIVRGVWPFGNSSVLTVDMGQQYIDFYSYYRQTLLGHPGQLFYAFNNALGGDMFGTWAYYLASPFNLVLLLFPKTMLDLAVAVMTLLKYGAAGLTMAYYLRRRGWRSLWPATFGFAYALSGWMVANQLNLMWFDGAVFLPLVLDGVERLIEERRPFRFIFWLTVAIVANYYMGYMICLFVVGYFFWAASARKRAWQLRVKEFLRFAGASLLAGVASAVLLLPTLFQLTQSKGTYTIKTIHWKFEYQPWKMLGKFFAGSFNFDQMPNGQPNVFVGSLVVIAFVLYFVLGKNRWQERLTALVWTGILTLSLMFEPLDLLWHGMQFPVWYNYRFSFVVCAWLILLAARALRFLPDGINVWQLALSLAVVLALCGVVWLNVDQFPYLSDQQVLTTFLFSVAAIVLLSVRADQRKWTPLLFMILILGESTSNMALSLNQISYVSHSDYHTYTEALREGVDKLNVTTPDRIGKTVLRTKNDAMQVGYWGTDQFSSLFEPSVPQFFGNIGQSAGDNFAAYTNGTVITDALLDIRYWLTPRTDVIATSESPFLPPLSPRPDLQRETRRGQTRWLTGYENDNALGLGFAASDKILKTKLIDGMPVTNQEMIMAALTGRDYQTLFDKIDLAKPAIKGGTWSAGIVSKKKIASTTTVTYTFEATSSDPYYLKIGSDFTDNLVSLTQNGVAVPIYDTFRDSELLNITPGEIGKKQTLVFTLNKDTANFSSVVLYRLNQSKVTADLATLKQSPWRIDDSGARHLSGTVSITKKDQVLMTTIPTSPGWHVTVDGQAVTPHKVLGLFMALELSRGTHRISMTYTPPYLWVGLIVTLVALLLILLWWWLTPRGRHSRGAIRPE